MRTLGLVFVLALTPSALAETHKKAIASPATSTELATAYEVSDAGEQAVRASVAYNAMAPYRAGLAAAKESSGWLKGPDPSTADSEAHGPLDWATREFQALLTAPPPKLKKADKPLAASVGERWDRRHRSNYKLHVDGSETQLVFHVRHHMEGRGVWETSTDYLVHYDNGRATHVYSAAMGGGPGHWEPGEETLYTLHWDDNGVLASVEQTTVWMTHDDHRQARTVTYAAT